MAPKQQQAKRKPSHDRGSKGEVKRPPRAEGAAAANVSGTSASGQAGAERLEFEQEIKSLLQPLAAHLKTQGVDHTKLLKTFPHREDSENEVVRTVAQNLRSTNRDLVNMVCLGLSSMLGNNALASPSFVNEVTKLNLEWATNDTKAPLLQAAKEAKDALGLAKVETLVVTTEGFSDVFKLRSVPVEFEAGDDIHVLGERLFAPAGSCKKWFPIVMLHGESGSGKTECVLRLARAYNVNGIKQSVVVACVTSASLPADESFELVSGPDDEPQRRVHRATNVKKAIKAALQATGAPWRQQCEWKRWRAKPEHLILVVFIDEASTHPLFVRALCDTAYNHGLEATLCADLGVHSVRFVVAGTGCDGADVSPGTLPPSYVTMRPRAGLVWKTLSQHPKIAQWNSRLCGTSATAAVTRELVSNARFAALLAKQLRKSPCPETGEWRWLLQRHLMCAAADFKRLSDLHMLPLGEYTYVVLLAFLLSRNSDRLQDDFRNTFDGDELRKALNCVLVDRAKLPVAAFAFGGPRGLAAVTFPASGRYEFGRHHLLMQRLIVDGLTFPDASRSSFERLTSEGMVQVVRMMSESLRPHALKIDPNVESGADWPCKTPQVDQHWVGEIAMIKWMAERVQHACSGGTVVRPGPVRRSFVSTRADGDTSLRKFLELFPACDEQGEELGPHHVVLNGDKASGPDVMVGVQLSNGKFVFFFVHCTNYLEDTALTASESVTETIKIGFPTKLGALKEALNPKAPRRSLALLISADVLKARFPHPDDNRPSWFDAALNLLEGGAPMPNQHEALVQAHIAVSDHPPAPPLVQRLLDDGHQVYGVLLVRDGTTKPGRALFTGIGHPKVLYVASPNDLHEPTKQWFLDRGEPQLALSFTDACPL
jgi:hypothetical protein